MAFIYQHILSCRVIDGDTVELEIDTGFCSKYKDKFRLAHINAPEGQGTPAHIRLTELCADAQKLNVQTFKRDKYGRWLAELYSIPGMFSINTQLVEEGLAEVYLK